MDLLKRLITAHGVSGDEGEVRTLIHKEIRHHVDDIRVDKRGNLICHKKGKKPAILLAAHMDEVGLMVRGIASDGMLVCAEIGGVIPVSIIGEKAFIRTKKGSIHGLITTREVSASTQPQEVTTTKDLIVDTGLSPAELEAWGVRVGTHVSFDKKAGYSTYGKKILGKALDNRIGCYLLIELAKGLKKKGHEIFFVFTVEEEVGLYGAWTSMYDLDPDWGIAVDTATATDLVVEELHKICLGKGPVLTVMDDRLIANRCLNEYLSSLAEKHHIPLQFDVTDKGTTDASVISVSKGGVPSTVLSVPVRNMHTPSGIAHRSDVENALRLLEALLANPPAPQCML